MNDFPWGAFWIIIICFGLPISAAGLYAYLWERRQKRLREARNKYRAALGRLKQDPVNNDLRRNALTLGRQYIRLASLERRSTFNEVALMNDLNAIQLTGTQAPDVQTDAETVKTRLATLESLFNEGVITKEEYETRRNEILSDL